MLQKIKKITALLLLSTMIFSISYADDIQDQLDVKTEVNNMRNSVQQPGVLGDIFTKIFDAEGKVKEMYLSIVTTFTQGFIPVWDDAGKLIDSPISSDGTNVSINGILSVIGNPDTGDDVGDRDYNDTRYLQIYTETDPKIGILTNGKWCRNNGTSIICDVDVVVDTDTQLSEIAVDSYVANNGYDITPDTIADDGIIQETEIAQNTLDDSEIEDNSLTAASLATNSVGDSELIDNPTFTSVTSVSFIYNSDRRLKKNIVSLEGSSLDKLTSLNGYTYDWKKDGTNDIGVIAQEVEEVFPMLVVTDNDTGLKAVKYGNFIAPIIESFKEMKILIEELFEKYLDQQEQIENLNERIKKLEENTLIN